MEFNIGAAMHRHSDPCISLITYIPGGERVSSGSVFLSISPLFSNSLRFSLFFLSFFLSFFDLFVILTFMLPNLQLELFLLAISYSAARWLATESICKPEMAFLLSSPSSSLSKSSKQREWQKCPEQHRLVVFVIYSGLIKFLVAKVVLKIWAWAWSMYLWWTCYILAIAIVNNDMLQMEFIKELTNRNTVCICYSVGLWFSKIYHYNRCIITSDVHSLRSDREQLFTAWAYPWTIDKIPNSMGCRVVFDHFFSLIHRSFFLLWLTGEKENL